MSFANTMAVCRPVKAETLRPQEGIKAMAWGIGTEKTNVLS